MGNRMATKTMKHRKNLQAKDGMIDDNVRSSLLADGAQRRELASSMAFSY